MPVETYSQKAKIGDAEPDMFGRVLLIVDEGSVVSKPSYVDLVEVKGEANRPIVVTNPGF